MENATTAAAKGATSGARLLGGHAKVTLLLCLMYALAYLDRVNLSAAASSVKAEFKLTNAELGLAFSGFSWAYLGTVLFGGWAAKRFGAKGVLFACMLLLGCATTATAFVSGVMSLFFIRLLVGAGEGPAFPAATQAMRNWYPPRRFGYIQGITHSASRLGAAITPPLVAWIIAVSDWRMSFVVTGGVVLVWAVAWWLLFKEDPRTDDSVDVEQLKDVAPYVPSSQARTPLWALVKHMYVVTLVMFTYGWAYWIFVSWLPLYFINQHHVDLKTSGALTTIPFLAGMIGNTVGGVVSDRLLVRTRNARLARSGVVAVSLAGCAAALVPLMFVADLKLVIPLLALAMFFLELTIAPMYAVPMDMSKTFAGMGSAFIIMGVGIAGITSPVVFGWLIDVTGNWNVPFATAVGVLVLGAAMTGLLRPDKKFEEA